jgi:hypothetical protein
MTRERHYLTRSHREQAQRHTGRSETHCAAPASPRHGPGQRVTGALSEGQPGNDLAFIDVSALSAEIVGESHGIGLSVLWTVLSDRSRGLPTSQKLR